MIRELLELFSIFDWITPTKGFIEDVANDPTLFQDNSWTFFVPFGQAIGDGWSPRGIENLLAKHGIRTWGGANYRWGILFQCRLGDGRLGRVHTSEIWSSYSGTFA